PGWQLAPRGGPGYFWYCGGSAGRVSLPSFLGLETGERSASSRPLFAGRGRWLLATGFAGGMHRGAVAADPGGAAAPGAGFRATSSQRASRLARPGRGREESKRGKEGEHSRTAEEKAPVGEEATYPTPDPSGSGALSEGISILSPCASSRYTVIIGVGIWPATFTRRQDQ